ncbi:hypothetical protein K469DRAFT_683997 [Zopfia rhizophila CBS 207.26]|uniref:Uncharacterized protein n=1 Tax=Zopfia rhizophila CBS 207.26 TaxID=1314779 RepID=A0A6A6D7N2_9PEZI|nr:hypothetical protein K469DRAFT_683997 [Zopfia rhizophila CBS 207.26]
MSGQMRNPPSQSGTPFLIWSHLLIIILIVPTSHLLLSLYGNPQSDQFLWVTMSGKGKEPSQNNLVLRMNCWHRSKGGESANLNHRLAEVFRSENLECWTAQNAAIGLSPENEPDASHDCHQLWEAIVPTISRFMRQIQRIPLFANIHARDITLCRSLRVKYSHSICWEQWKIKKLGDAALKVGKTVSTHWDQWDKSKKELNKHGSEVASVPTESFSNKEYDTRERIAYHETAKGQSAIEKRNGRTGVDLNAIQQTIQDTLKLNDAVTDILQDNTHHSKEVRNSIMEFLHRLSHPYMVFKDHISHLERVIADINPAASGQAETPQIPDKEGTADTVCNRRNNLNVQCIHDAAKIMRSIILLSSRLEDDLEGLLQAVEYKHDNNKKFWENAALSRLAIAGYAAIYFFCLGVAGGVGAITTVGGGYVSNNERISKRDADEVRSKFGLVKRFAMPLFAVIAILFYEEVFQMPFNEYNKQEQASMLNEFGVDLEVIGEQDYLTGKLDKAVKDWSSAYRQFSEHFDRLLNNEGLTLRRSYDV